MGGIVGGHIGHSVQVTGGRTVGGGGQVGVGHSVDGGHSVPQVTVGGHTGGSGVGQEGQVGGEGEGGASGGNKEEHQLTSDDNQY